MKQPPPYAPVLIRLLQRPLYSDSTAIWDLLFRHRDEIESYFSQLGLEVVVAEHDGLAFLRKAEDGNDEGSIDLPALTTRRELTYLASLICVLLVEELYRHEASGAGSNRLVLKREQIRAMVKPYLPAMTNEVKQAEGLDAQINRLEGYGFLRSVGEGGEDLEVTKLLKYKVDAARIAELKDRLASYKGGNNV
jgi:hypothetical protein